MGSFASDGKGERVTVVGIGEQGGAMVEELLMNRISGIPHSFSYVLPPTSALTKTQDNLMRFGERRHGGDERRNIYEISGEGPLDENWLDRTLMAVNPAYARLRSFGNNMVDWARDVVYNSDIIFLISDLIDESLDICLLLDAFSNKAGRRLIVFLIQSERYKNIWNVQFLNKRIQEVAFRPACVIITPPIGSGNFGTMPEILIALYNLIRHTGTINIDLADIKNIAGYGNIGMMGVGAATGENRAEDAIKEAISQQVEQPHKHDAKQGGEEAHAELTGTHDSYPCLEDQIVAGRVRVPGQI